MLCRLFCGAPTLLFLLLLSFGFERARRGGLGLELQAPAFFCLALLPLPLDRFEPHAFFVLGEFGRRFSLAQEALALGRFFGGAALLFFLQALELRLPRAVCGRALFVHQPLTFRGIRCFPAPSLFVELLPLRFARPFSGDTSLLHQPLTLHRLFRLAAKTLFFVALPLCLVRTLRRGLRLPQQFFTLGSVLGLEAVLLLLQPDALFLQRPFDGGLGLTRRAFGSRGLFDPPTTASFLGPAGFRLLGTALRLLGLLLVARAFLLDVVTKAGLVGLGRLTQPCLLLFGRLSQTSLFGLSGCAHARLFVLGCLLRSYSCRVFRRGSRRSHDGFIVRLDFDDLRSRVSDRMLLRDLLGPELGGARQVAAQFFSENGLITATDRLRFLLSPEPTEKTPGARFLGHDRAGQHRHGVRLDVLGAVQRSQVRDQLLFIPRRHQRREQDHIRHSLRNRRDRGITRIDDLDLAADILLHKVAQQGGLAGIGFEREYQRHVRPTFSP